MAKLIPTGPGTGTPAPGLVTSTGHATQASGPVPFAVVPPASAKAAKSPKKATVAKTPRISPELWFQENFSCLSTDVVQIRKYPSRKEGFHCPTCGIAGSNGIVIKALEGKGELIDIYEVDPATREQKKTGEIRGFIVGATCLRKYGKVDVTKL